MKLISADHSGEFVSFNQINSREGAMFYASELKHLFDKEVTTGDIIEGKWVERKVKLRDIASISCLDGQRPEDFLDGGDRVLCEAEVEGGYGPDEFGISPSGGKYNTFATWDYLGLRFKVPKEGL